MLAKRCSDVKHVESMHEGMYVQMHSMKFGLDGNQPVCEQTLQYLLAIKNPMLCISTCMPASMTHYTFGSFHAASSPANTVCMLILGIKLSSDAKINASCLLSVVQLRLCADAECVQLRVCVDAEWPSESVC